MIEENTHTKGYNAVPHGQTWQCGTLTYTRQGIAKLFFFLLWGGFSFTMMMMVTGTILPLKLKSLGSSNLLIGFLLTSIFPMFGMFISPYLSFKSDYLRTRWGRRLPFFVCTLPFVTATIFMLAFSEDIARFLRNCGVLASLSPTSAAIGVIGVSIVAFQFADVVIASVYNYIFNDTVPTPLIGRFFGLMSMVGGALSFVYNFWVFKYAEVYMKEIFCGTAVLYFVGIGMMCLFVKEGEYPPVTEEDRKKITGISGIKTYFKESFCDKFYWTKFSYMATGVIAGAIGPFGIFFQKQMGLPLDYIGKAAAVTAGAGIVAAYFASVFVDRWHPLRIVTYSAVFAAAFSMGGWVWLFVTLPPEAFFWLNMLGGGLIGVFHGSLCGLTGMPLDIRLQPKSRFGQFCSAQSIVSNSCKVVAGVLAGLFFDFLKWLCNGSDYAYRFNFVWSGVMAICSAVLICSLYRQWKTLGGDLHFKMPTPWTEEGYETQPATPFAGAQTRWLNVALIILRLLMVLSVIYLFPLAFWLSHIGWAFESNVYLFAVIPASAVIYAVWMKVERALRADIARCAAGEPTKDGIPHHGILIVKGSVLLLGVPIAIATVIVAINSGLKTGSLVFGIAPQIANFMVIVALLVLRRLERGYDPMLDYDQRAVTEAPLAPAELVS